MDDFTFGELFAGVGGFSLGFEQAGWVCRWQVEWDRHCQQVLARHWPEVARYGDVRDVAGGRVLLDSRTQGLRSIERIVTDHQGRIKPRHSKSASSVLDPVTCITFGSPCQDLSVAGKRAGLDGARSGLFFEAIRIIKEMRNATAGTLPRFAIWENVAGALSSNKGADFLAVLDAFAEIGAVDIAWRLVDAQHFGVPQRRRRVFVVADFGGESAGAIHVEPAGMRWHPPQGRTARQDVAGSVGDGVAGVVNALTKSLGAGGPDDNEAQAGWLIPQVVGTLSAGAHPGGFNGQDAYSGQLVVQPFPVQSKAIGRTDIAGQNGKGYGQQGDPMFTLDGAGPHAIVQPFVKAKRASPPDDDESWRADQISPTLNVFDNNSDSRATVIVPTLDANYGKGPGERAGVERTVIPNGHTVRRLTPLECERLMGWPDHHTRWKADGTEQSDSQRYRQAGNGVAAPCAAWLAWNLRTALETE